MPFQPRPQIAHQTYCSAPACQRARRQQWQHQKLQTDADYKDNQARAQQAWRERHPDYWREYRDSHPDYVEKNRAMQRARNTKATDRAVAKMDASEVEISLASGIYQIRSMDSPRVANMNVWTVEIRVLRSEEPPPFN
jgi:chorismate synthase